MELRSALICLSTEPCERNCCQIYELHVVLIVTFQHRNSPGSSKIKRHIITLNKEIFKVSLSKNLSRGICRLRRQYELGIRPALARQFTLFKSNI